MRDVVIKMELQDVAENEEGKSEESQSEMASLHQTQFLSEEEFKECIREYGARLLMYARQFVNDRQEAESVLQDAFIRLWREGYNRRYTLLQQLYTRVRSSAIDYLRRNQRRSRREHIYMTDIQNDSWFDHRLTDDEDARRQELERALQALPGPQREVLTMKIWGGLTFQEIADTLGESLGTVASRYRLALQKLRSQVNKEVVL